MEIKIEGMSCSHCSGRVEQALNAIDGVSAKVDLEKKTAFVTSSENITEEQIKAAVEDAGYTVVSVKQLNTMKAGPNARTCFIFVYMLQNIFLLVDLNRELC